MKENFDGSLMESKKTRQQYLDNRTYAKLSQQGAPTQTVRVVRQGGATPLGRFCVSPIDNLRYCHRGSVVLIARSGKVIFFFSRQVAEQDAEFQRDAVSSRSGSARKSPARRFKTCRRFFPLPRYIGFWHITLQSSPIEHACQETAEQRSKPEQP